MIVWANISTCYAIMFFPIAFIGKEQHPLACSGMFIGVGLCALLAIVLRCLNKCKKQKEDDSNECGCPYKIEPSTSK